MKPAQTETDLTKFGPAWAHGCEKCKFGLINPPPVHGVYIGMYVVRAIQMDKGFLVFCDCKAGETYEKYLKARLVDIRARRDLVDGAYWKQVIEQAVEASLAPAQRETA